MPTPSDFFKIEYPSQRGYLGYAVLFTIPVDDMHKLIHKLRLYACMSLRIVLSFDRETQESPEIAYVEAQFFNSHWLMSPAAVSLEVHTLVSCLADSCPDAKALHGRAL